MILGHECTFIHQTTISSNVSSISFILNSISKNYFRIFSSRIQNLYDSITPNFEKNINKIFWNTKWQKKRFNIFLNIITGNLAATDGQFFTSSIYKINPNQLQIETLLRNLVSIPPLLVVSRKLSTTYQLTRINL